MLRSDVPVTTVRLHGEFPGRREKCREFRGIGRFSAKSVPKTSTNPVVCEEIPYVGAQGIISRAQGFISAFRPEQGISQMITDCICNRRRAPDLTTLH